MSLQATDMFRLARQVESSESIAKGLLIKEIQAQVKSAAENGLLSTMFHVPIILGGCPAYNHSEVCEMLSSHFRSNGFEVSVGGTVGVLKIGWDLNGQQSARSVETGDVHFIYSPQDT